MPDTTWSFCRLCAFHSSGTFEKCPECGNESVNVIDNKPLLDETWTGYLTGKEERG